MPPALSLACLVSHQLRLTPCLMTTMTTMTTMTKARQKRQAKAEVRPHATPLAPPRQVESIATQLLCLHSRRLAG